MNMYDAIGIGVIVLEITVCALMKRKIKSRLEEIDGLQGIISGRAKGKIIGKIEK